MAEDEIVVRRATLSDYEAVLDINRNVYDGLDYMPAMYYEFLQSRDHRVYVAESVKDRKLVGLMNFKTDDERGTYNPLSARVRGEFQKGGIIIKLFGKFRQDHPNVKYCVFDSTVTDIAERRLADSLNRLVYQWNGILVRIANNSLKSWASLRSAQPPVSCGTPFLTTVQLTRSSADELLSSGRLESLLRRFAIEYIPGIDPTWAAVPVNTCGLANILRTSTVTLASYDPTSNLCSISFQNSIALRSGRAEGHMAADVFFYGDTLDDLYGHVTAHLRHLANVAGTSDVFLKLHFPSSIDHLAVETEFEKQCWPAGMREGIELRARGYVALRNVESKL